MPMQKHKFGKRPSRIWVKKKKTYITELEEAEFAEVRDGSVRGLGGNDELDKGHLLGAHQIHGGQVLYELLHGSKFSRETNRNWYFFFSFFLFFVLWSGIGISSQIWKQTLFNLYVCVTNSVCVCVLRCVRVCAFWFQFFLFFLGNAKSCICKKESENSHFFQSLLDGSWKKKNIRTCSWTELFFFLFFFFFKDVTNLKF